MNDDRMRGIDLEGDPALTALIRDLDALHGASLPAPLRTSISQSLRKQMHALASEAINSIDMPPLGARTTLAERTARRRQIRQPSSHTWPVVFATAFVVICLALVAALTRQIVSVAPATSATPTRSISRVTDTYASTICGYRVTVTHAYADANRVIVGYTVVQPTGRRFLDGFFNNALDGFYDNAQLRMVGGVELTGGGSASRPEDLGGAGASFTTLGHASGTERDDVFETIDDNTSIRSATFLFELPALRATEFSGATPAVHACERYGAAGAGIRQVTVPGPFLIRFTIPVQAARRAELQWSVGSGQSREIVERIVVTPTETRIFVRGSGQYPPQIRISDVRPYHGPDGSFKQGGEKVFVYNDYATYYHSLYHKPNPWTLAVLSEQALIAQGVGPPFATRRVNLS
jgi:hypothetical protein